MFAIAFQTKKRKASKMQADEDSDVEEVLEEITRLMKPKLGPAGKPITKQMAARPPPSRIPSQVKPGAAAAAAVAPASPTFPARVVVFRGARDAAAAAGPSRRVSQQEEEAAKGASRRASLRPRETLTAAAPLYIDQSDSSIETNSGSKAEWSSEDEESSESDSGSEASEDDEHVEDDASAEAGEHKERIEDDASAEEDDAEDDEDDDDDETIARSFTVYAPFSFPQWGPLKHSLIESNVFQATKRT